MRFIDRVIGMITKPDVTTGDIADDPRIEEGLFIVGIYTIFFIIGAYVSTTRIHYVGSYMGISASMQSMMMLIGGVIGALIYGLIGWPVVAGACHLLSLFMGGRGKFYPQMMTLIGYASLPLIAVLVISTIVALMTPVTTIDLGQLNQGTHLAKNALSNLSPISIFGMIIAMIGSLWTAYLTACSVKNGEKVGRNNALIIAGLLFIASQAITYSSLILALI